MENAAVVAAQEAAEALVIGAGPNGLAAAITLAEAGHSVELYERADTVGGGVRSAELTLPGFIHDVCSAIHPFGRISPFLGAHADQLGAAGLTWVQAPAAIAHPLDDAPAILVTCDVDETAQRLGTDRDAYRRLISPLVDHWAQLGPHILAPFHVPLSPPTALRMARFGLQAIRSAKHLVGGFREERAKALFAGAAAHSILPLTEGFSGGAGLLLLATAHVDGWPFPEGGANRLSDALAAVFTRAGGGIVTGVSVDHLADLPPHRAALFDVVPKHLASICGDRLTGGYRRSLRRFRHGSGIFKIDFAIEGAIPWRDPEVARAGSVHLGGTFDEIAAAEAEVASGGHPERPFVLVAQQSNFDRTRAPQGKNTVWAYAHVPNGSNVDMTEPILRQVERFAPGFRSQILAMHSSTPADLERYNPNNVGGDIAGGRFDLRQLFNRPARPWNPYSTPDPGIYICSSSTPPGAGVHGMSGYHAAQAALRRIG